MIMKNKQLNYIVYVFVFLLLVIISSCKKDDPVVVIPDDNVCPPPTPYQWPEEILRKTHFPTAMNIPKDNPMTVEGVELGRWLFYDGRMSGRTHQDSLMSCATCHIQKYNFTVGINHPEFIGGQTFGIPDEQYPNGKPTPHYVMPLINLVFNNKGYLWNGMINENNPNLGSAAYGVPPEPQYHMRNIESLVWMGIHAQHEINGTVEKTVNLIKSIPEYPPLFCAAFGTPEINYDRISKAISQFIRTLISYNSKFHKKVRGEINFTPAENRGYFLLVSEEADCFHCHGGDGNPLMTTNDFYNNGKDSFFTGIYADPRDRFAYTGNDIDRGAYKASTLINVHLVAPYMHDGRFKTIEEVVDFYSDDVINNEYVHPLMEWAFQGGVHLPENKKQDLLAFLRTMEDNSFLTNPDFAPPDGLDPQWINQSDY
jgi:cytochrome c peroxidase